MSLFSLLFGSLTVAYAVPQQLTQQGRLLDNNGAAVHGQHNLTFRLFPSGSGNNPIWEETIVTVFTEGYYRTILGNNATNPIDDSILSSGPLFLEVEVDNNGPMSPRQEIKSTPFARHANQAESLEGGNVNATQISVSGNLVIDSNGAWVGPTTIVEWADITGIPADISDGDNDTLAGINCSAGEILGWNGSAWTCAADNGLTEAEVEAFVTNDALDLHPNTTLGGFPILSEGNSGTLSGLSCQNGELAKWDAMLMGWTCEIDLDTDTILSEADVEAYVTNGNLDLNAATTLNGETIVTTLTDQNTQLSEGQVESYVTNGSLDLNIATTLGGQSILTNPNCQVGEVLSWNGSDWVCSTFNALLDSDQDGILAWNDCDDSDPTASSKLEDADCDGTLTADDCNDSNPNSTIVANDADCDGIETLLDCNDNDSNQPSNDADCDGVLAIVDCDDSDANVPALDNDCDGIETSLDCDDNDPNLSGNDGVTSNCAGTSCFTIYDGGFSTGDGVYWIDPTGNSPFEAYCYMSGDWPGSTLVISTTGDVSGTENHTGARGGTPTANSNNYSKFSDAVINALKNTSPSVNPYISRATKSNFSGGQGSYCVGFVSQSCTFTLGGAANSNCENSWVSQSSSDYCSREQSSSSYRGFDGHRCPNSQSNAWGSYSDVNNQFMIFEHTGGTHYCGGWDTSWNKVELLIR